jgi:hypothetical protein
MRIQRIQIRIRAKIHVIRGTQILTMALQEAILCTPCGPELEVKITSILTPGHQTMFLGITQYLIC